VYIAVVAGPLLTLPQVYSIWIDDQRGVSSISWFAYLGTSIIWLVYGVKHRDKPLVLVEFAWIALSIMILVGLHR